MTTRKKNRGPKGPIEASPAPKVPVFLRRAAAGGALALGLGLAPACGDDSAAPMPPPVDSGGPPDAAPDSDIAPMPPPMPAPIDSGLDDAAAPDAGDASATDSGSASDSGAASDSGSATDAIAPMPPPMVPPMPAPKAR